MSRDTCRGLGGVASVLLAAALLFSTASHGQIGICSVNPPKFSEKSPTQPYLTFDEGDQRVTAIREVCQLSLQDLPVDAAQLDLGGATAMLVPSGTSDPAACEDDELFFRTDTGALRYCSDGATNTWSSISAGSASTATALAANGANCSAGSFPLGVDASGAAESCTPAQSAVTQVDIDGDSTREINLASSVLQFDPDEDAAYEFVMDGANGRLGIGATSPTAPLHISKSDGSAKMLIQDTGATFNTQFELQKNGTPRFRFNNTADDPGGTWDMGLDGSSYFLLRDIEGANNVLVLTQGAVLDLGGSTPSIEFSDTDASGSLRVVYDETSDRAYHDTDADGTRDAGEGWLGNFLNVTDAPAACSTSVEGYMYYDDSLSEPCFCDGTNYQQFDGGGTC